MIDTSRYDAYGEKIGGTGNVTNKYLFAGEQYDSNLGDYYLRARYYDAESGRFTRRDTYEGSFWEPPTLHKYAYAHNNPSNLTDPSGLSALLEYKLDSLIAAEVIEKILRNAILITAIGILGVGTYLIAEEVDDLVASFLEAKRGPIPVGGPHNDKIAERIKQLEEDEGMEHVAGGDKTEEVIPTPGGKKSSRRPDITMKKKDGTTYRENVGKKKKDGTPIKREKEALDDIENATGERPGFTNYN